jgi:K+-sensing histidine kinase KdpD
MLDLAFVLITILFFLARAQGITQIFMGRSQPRPFWKRFGGNVVQQVVRQARDIQITIVAERRR